MYMHRPSVLQWSAAKERETMSFAGNGTASAAGDLSTALPQNPGRARSGRTRTGHGASSDGHGTVRVWQQMR